MSPFQASERPQIFFHISGMMSPQSADAVKGALMRLDDRATVRIDLPMRRVEIDPTSAGPAAFRAAIADVGYSSIRQWLPDGAYI